MNNYGFHKLQISTKYSSLIPPLSKEEYEQLEENILNDGCREPIIIWNKTIIDGHNRYKICSDWELPFSVREITFSSEEEAVKWICANQLGRRNISEETRKYLIGQKYEAEKIIGARNVNGHNQYTLNDKKTAAIINKTAHKIGDEYHISHNTVYKYGTYATALDKIALYDKEIAKKILSGQIRISHENVLKLSYLPPEDIKKLKELFSNPETKHIDYNDMQHELHWKKYSPKRKITEPGFENKSLPVAEIKQMPAYDPDAEISSLTLTIPSWVSSITRAFNASDLTRITPTAASKLHQQLLSLQNTINTYLHTISEDSNE